MKLTQKISFLAITLFLFNACSSDSDIDKDLEKPTLTIQFDEAFPKACEQLQRGQTYTFKAKATDNVGLVAYSIDVHHNFDHHTHDDQGVECDLGPIKTPVNPFLFKKNFTLEQQPTAYELSITVEIPNNIDVGDYHCAYSITDQTGWQTQTSIDIKIIE
ncbi:DUF4625 domain-containing protein [Ochrovirga pacifica]|uniref:DUF4625 domain-containing protein n=1 Tax=Ochrovirga pacifica TaxID=1042376 RepID=UPI000255776F|nr:DUF4625 domain-containing protein [Ochrovirga pacifica]